MTAARCACCGEVASARVQLYSRREIQICYRCLDWLNLKRSKQDAATGGVGIAGMEPIFSVVDLERSADHYRRLGFTISYRDDTSAFAHRDGWTIHRSSEPTTAGGGALYLHVDDADQLAQDWRKAGLEVAGPQDYPWAKREGSHTDPDGNLVRFGSPLRRQDSDRPAR